MIKCKYCGGSGKQHSGTSIATQGLNGYSWDCEACYGTGKVSEDDPEGGRLSDNSPLSQGR